MREQETMEPLSVIGAAKYQSAIEVVKASRIKTNQFELLRVSFALFAISSFVVHHRRPWQCVIKTESLTMAKKIGNSNHEFELHEGTTRSGVNRTHKAGCKSKFTKKQNPNRILEIASDFLKRILRPFVVVRLMTWISVQNRQHKSVSSLHADFSLISRIRHENAGF